MPEYSDLELSFQRADADSFRVGFRFSQPGSDGDISLQALARINLLSLADMISLPEEYGPALTSSLFADENLKTAFAQARTTAHNLGQPLRLRLLIDPDAFDLHNIAWELLRDPQDGSPLGMDETVFLSRYLTSQDWRPVRLKSRVELQGLVLISNPSDLLNYKLPAVNIESELDRARAGLAEIPFQTLVSGKLRPTLANLISSLHNAPQPVDILYLVCHGTLVNEQPVLYLEGEDGKSDKVPGNELVARLKDLFNRPRLILLISCQSAGKGSGDALAALGPRLAEIGIPAIVAMQANLSMETSEKFLPVLFKELQRDGLIDRALAVARGAVRDQPDFWVPVLYMRLKSGRLWYTPGFGVPGGEFEKWPSLVRAVQSGQCTPILGPGVTDALLGSMRDLAQEWADDLQYPLSPYERDSLPQVAQYRTVDQDRSTAEEEWMALMRSAILGHTDLPEEAKQPGADLNQMLEAARKQFLERDQFEPYNVLARLPVKVYITANTDELLENALRDAGRDPVTMVCPWREFSFSSEVTASILKAEYDPTPEKPLVYHLFGLLSQPESIVLTEDDTFQFLIGTTRHMRNIPDQVGRALTFSALLFLGFQIDDWNFRVLLHTLLSKEGNNLLSRFAHVSAQIEPEEGRLINPARARRYLERYFARPGDIDINIYWGSAREFLKDLQARLIQPVGVK